MPLHIINVTHFVLVLVAFAVIVTYGLNIGALSEANVLVDPKPDVTAELVMSSFFILLSAFAIVSVFVDMGAVQWFVESKHLVLTMVLSLVMVATYGLNLAILNTQKDTEMRPIENSFNGALVGFAALIFLVALLRMIYGSPDIGAASYTRNVTETLLNNNSGSSSGWFDSKKSANVSSVNPVDKLSQLISDENKA